MEETPVVDENEPVNLKTLDLEELQAYAEELGEPDYRGTQLFRWLYGQGVDDFSAMSNLPKSLRSRLAETARAPTPTQLSEQVSSDGTVKVIFRLPSGRRVESVLIPDFDETGDARRLTVCVSSQVGCAMGCRFCATGKMGFHQNLTAGEIFDQVWQVNEIARKRYDRRITNVVFMGMGEPMLNLDAVRRSIRILTHPKGMNLSWKRITVSTVGLARRIRDLADAPEKTHLAVSLHAPSDEQRKAIMPVSRSEKTDLSALEDAIRYYYEETGRDVTYEYCLFDGVNDSDLDARRLAKISRWVPSKVNLITYNPVPGTDFSRTPAGRMDRFIQALVDEGVTVTVRRSRGEDIDAACGQLADEEAA